MQKGLSDTPPEVEKRLIEGYRRMSVQQKLEQVAALNQMLLRLAMADVRRRYPEASQEECRLRVASRWLPREIMCKVFHWDPQEKGY